MINIMVYFCIYALCKEYWTYWKHSCDRSIISLWTSEAISSVSCQKGPTRHAYEWQIGPFWQDTLDMASWIYVTISCGNGLPQVQHQAIAFTSDDLLPVVLHR